MNKLLVVNIISFVFMFQLISNIEIIKHLGFKI